MKFLIKSIRNLAWRIEDLAELICSHTNQYDFNNDGYITRVCPDCGAVGLNRDEETNDSRRDR